MGKSVNYTKDKAIKYAKEHKVEKSVIMTAAGAANCTIDYNDINKEINIYDENNCYYRG